MPNAPTDSGTSEQDRQFYLDERIAAARALGKTPNYQATEALVQILKTEKDVALRDQAHESLQMATGHKLPAEAAAWEQLLRESDPGRGAVADKNKPEAPRTIIPAGGGGTNTPPR